MATPKSTETRLSCYFVHTNPYIAYCNYKLQFLITNYKLYYIISYLHSIILQRKHSDNIQSYHHKSRDKNNKLNKVINIEMHIFTNYTTIYMIISKMYRFLKLSKVSR